jgi:hypothetical protein
MSTPANRKLVRFQFEIDQAQLDEVKELAKAGGLRTKKDLFINALTLLQWMVDKKAKGFTIIARDETGRVQELQMPFLEAVASSAKSKKDP